MATARNDLAFVRRVLSLLDHAGAPCWLFGGWAEDLHGLRAPAAAHKDLDLLYPARDFTHLDAVISRLGLQELAGKRLPHKRAFLLDGIMVELFLVGADTQGLHTRFFDSARHDWPAGALSAAQGLPAASPSALIGYRSAHSRLRRHAPAAA